MRCIRPADLWVSSQPSCTWQTDCQCLGGRRVLDSLGQLISLNEAEGSTQQVMKRRVLAGVAGVHFEQ